MQFILNSPQADISRHNNARLFQFIAIKICLWIGITFSSTLATDSQGQQMTDSSRVFFVSQQGDDAWSGMLPEAKAEKNDGPFHTLERARDEIRKLKQQGSYPEKGAVVVIRGGSYWLNSPFSLTEEDSGTATGTVIYSAFPGEEVRLSGGRLLQEFAPVSDLSVLSQLDETAKVRVYQTSLRKQGINHYGPVDGGGIEIFQDDMPLHISRWPNEGFVKIKDLVVDDGHQIHGISGSTVGKFTYDGDRPEKWINEKDPWLHGYWFWDWSDQRQQIASIDAEAKQITLKEPFHYYGYRKGQWYYAFNLLSEIDSPGEFYIDREEGILYIWPLTYFWGGNVVASVLENVVEIKGTSHFCFSGITFEMSRGTAITVEGGENGILEGCTIHNVGGQGIEITGQNHIVSGCDIYQTGRGGISISGGDRKTLEPGNISVINNHIHDYGRFYRMYQPGVLIQGVGNRVANNLIHNAPHIGIMFGGNEHRIEYNEIHHVCLESNDAGAIYAGRDWTQRGNIIRYNYMHDINGFKGKGCVGVYLDDMFASAEIFGNVFHKVTAAAFIGGGRDCTIENNIFVDCDPAVHVDARALGWAHYHADEWLAEANSSGTLSGIEYRKEPYASRYPRLFNILDQNPKAPEGNLIARNISVGGKWDRIEDAARPFLTILDNMVDQDPLFTDPSNEDFSLKDDSPAYASGFKPIPMNEIGLFRNNHEVSSHLFVNLENVVTPALSSADQFKFISGLAQRAAIIRSYNTATALFSSMMEIAPVTEIYALDAMIEYGNLVFSLGDQSRCREIFRIVADNPQAPSSRKGIAQLQIAKSFSHENMAQEAIAEYNKVKNIENIPSHFVWEAEERIKTFGDTLKTVKDKDTPDAHQAKSVSNPVHTIYVNTDGSDQSAGTSEKPFATIQRALESLKEFSHTSKERGIVRIELADGVYSLNHTIEVNQEHSGTEKSPVIISAATGAKVIFTGGKRIDNFKPVTDQAILERIPEESRALILQTNLREQGIDQFGQLGTRGYGIDTPPGALELFCNDTPMTPACWPNEGFVRTGKVLQKGLLSDNQAGRFVFDNPCIDRWRNATDIMLYGYWFYDWADGIVALDEIDFVSRTITTDGGTVTGIKEGQPFRVFNLLEEIDQPGEWYIDRDSGTLYCYPPVNSTTSVYEISMLDGPMINLKDVSHLILGGITFETGRGNGIVLNRCQSCEIRNCTVCKLGGTGIAVQQGLHNRILTCDINTLGRGGISLTGGDRQKLDPAHHVVDNCHIHNFSRIDRTYTPAVFIDGVGMIISHNRIHDTPCQAFRIEGNDHLIEYNEIYDVVKETDDQGGIDMWANPTYRGTIIRYNYWHDIGNGEPCGQAGIRLDDAICGTLIYGNVFHRIDSANFGGVQIHGGKDNWVDNNLFVDCRYAISLSPWDDKRWHDYIATGWVQSMISTVNAINPPYTSRYPELLRLDKDLGINHIWRNVAVNSVRFIAHDDKRQDQLGNVVTHIHPRFVDSKLDHQRFQIDPDLLRLSAYQQIPFEKIGNYDPAKQEMGNSTVTFY